MCQLRQNIHSRKRGGLLVRLIVNSRARHEKFALRDIRGSVSIAVGSFKSPSYREAAAIALSCLKVRSGSTVKQIFHGTARPPDHYIIGIVLVFIKSKDKYSQHNVVIILQDFSHLSGETN